MSVTGPLYISPPTFEDDIFALIFSAVLGLATFIQLFNLVSFTAVANLINQPYVPSLTMVARIEAEFYLNFLNVLVYAGVGLFMGGLMFVAYVGNFIDLLIMLLVIPLIGLFIYILVTTTSISLELRRESVYQFYEKYCDKDGRLLPVYLNLVYGGYEEQEENLMNEAASGEAEEKKLGRAPAPAAAPSQPSTLDIPSDPEAAP